MNPDLSLKTLKIFSLVQPHIWFRWRLKFRDIFLCRNLHVAPALNYSWNAQECGSKNHFPRNWISGNYSMVLRCRIWWLDRNFVIDRLPTVWSVCWNLSSTVDRMCLHDIKSWFVCSTVRARCSLDCLENVCRKPRISGHLDLSACRRSFPSARFVLVSLKKPCLTQLNDRRHQARISVPSSAQSKRRDPWLSANTSMDTLHNLIKIRSQESLCICIFLNFTPCMISLLCETSGVRCILSQCDWLGQ
jgi:hypothetical protein